MAVAITNYRRLLHLKYKLRLKRSPRPLYIMLMIKQINSAVDQRVQIRATYEHTHLQKFHSHKTQMSYFIFHRMLIFRLLYITIFG